MDCFGDRHAAVASLVLGTLSRKRRRTTPSSCTCPLSPAAPCSADLVLWWLAYRDNICGLLRKPPSRHLNVVLHTGEHSGLATACHPRIESQSQLSTAFRARMLRNQKK